MTRLIMMGINYEDGAGVEALDDHLAWLRGQLAGARSGVKGFAPENAPLLRRSVVRTYLDLRKARAADRHSSFTATPGLYACSGIPCRRELRA